MSAINSPRKSDSNRQKIIEAAYDLFYHQGFNQTSFSDIAEAASFPRGNFYYYFKSKDELLSEVVQYQVARMKQMIAEWNSATSDPAKRLIFLAEMLESSREDLIRYGCPLGTLTAELGKTQAGLQKEAVHMFDVLIDWLVEQLEFLNYGEKSRILAMHVIGRLQGITTMAFAYGDNAYIDYEVEGLRGELQKLASREQ
jgi:AcrR family transcriptional regulator